MERPVITRSCVKPMFETGYLSVYDLQYEEGRHYYDVSRRPMDRLIAVKNAEEFRSVYADAVTCIVIIETENEGKLTDLSELLHFTEQYRTVVERLLSLEYGSLVLIDIPSLKELTEQIHIHWEKKQSR